MKCFGLGLNKWGMFNKKCDGKKQSPINITTASVVRTNNFILGPLKLENDWKPSTRSHT